MSDREIAIHWLEAQLEESQARQQKWREDYQASVKALEQELEERMKGELVRVQAIRELLRTEQSAISAYSPEQKRSDLAGMTVADAASIVLEEQASEMHVSDITAELLARGVRLEGATPRQTVYVSLLRDQRFERGTRATFWLAGPRGEGNQKPEQSSIGPISGSEAVLRETGHPMHVRALLKALMDRGLVSNARRPLAMLSGTLRRSSKFKVVAPETFALAEWDAME